MLASLITLGIIQALYVISESDVAQERKMIAAGVSLSEFSGYEDLREPAYDDYDEDDTCNDENEYEDDEVLHEEDDEEDSVRKSAESRVFYYDMNDIHENNK